MDNILSFRFRSQDIITRGTDTVLTLGVMIVCCYSAGGSAPSLQQPCGVPHPQLLITWFTWKSPFKAPASASASGAGSATGLALIMTMQDRRTNSTTAFCILQEVWEIRLTEADVM